ncbi:MAG: hypothetical protein JWM95_1719 [Gemmatimonadetes bacterium]|nr:hypothetical protein [Gemmatimonadota bacterium]
MSLTTGGWEPDAHEIAQSPHRSHTMRHRGETTGAEVAILLTVIVVLIIVAVIAVRGKTNCDRRGGEYLAREDACVARAPELKL